MHQACRSFQAVTVSEILCSANQSAISCGAAAKPLGTRPLNSAWGAHRSISCRVESGSEMGILRCRAEDSQSPELINRGRMTM